MNSTSELRTGWSTEEAVGRPLEEVFHIINELTREICENPATKVLESGQIIGLANHTVLIARDGAERSIADSGARCGVYVLMRGTRYGLRLKAATTAFVIASPSPRPPSRGPLRLAQLHKPGA